MRKGFTLIELLAVIIILAIILVITVPQILGVIKSSKMGAMESDAKLVLSAINRKKVIDKTFNPLDYNDNLNGLLNAIELKSDNYTSVTFEERDNTLYIAVIGKEKYNGFSACGNYNRIRVKEGSCVLDFEAPVITLNGNTEVDVEKGTVYNELGATATDNIDGSLTVTITGIVDTNTIGEYIITYTAIDSSGNMATTTRLARVKILGFAGPGYIASKGVNGPELATGMVPIVWNGTTWVDTNANDVNWYNYTSTDKKWANARTTDGSMWVWIPRYAYKVTNGFHTYVNSSTAGDIDIKFLIDNTTDTSDSTSIVDTLSTDQTSADVYVKHPAFKFGTKEINGIWVAKFESSAVPSAGSTNYTGSCTATDNTSTNKVIKIVPNATSWRCISFSNQFTVSLNMKNRTDVYGWNSNEVDTHMMKNIEWGATIYLTRSQYGKNNEKIWNNNSSTYVTGCYGAKFNAPATSGCQRPYSDTIYGINGSTTGNIYGIYDTNGGAWEAVSAYVNNGNAVLTNASFSNIYNADLKYKDVYQVGATDNSTNNYAAASTRYGDAMWETSANASGGNLWHGGMANVPYNVSPWILRGGYFGVMYSIFTFSYNYDMLNTGFRPVLLIGSNL